MPAGVRSPQVWWSRVAVRRGDGGAGRGRDDWDDEDVRCFKPPSAVLAPTQQIPAVLRAGLTLQSCGISHFFFFHNTFVNDVSCCLLLSPLHNSHKSFFANQVCLDQVCHPTVLMCVYDCDCLL